MHAPPILPMLVRRQHGRDGHPPVNSGADHLGGDRRVHRRRGGAVNQQVGNVVGEDGHRHDLDEAAVTAPIGGCPRGDTRGEGKGEGLA